MDEQTTERKIGKEDLAGGLSVLLRMFAKYRSEMIVFIILGILSAVGDAAIPYLIGSFVDALSAPNLEYAIFGIVVPLYGAILFVWALVQIGLITIDRHEGRESDAIGLRMWADYMVHALSHVIRLPMSFHKQQKMGEVFRKIDMAGDAIERVFANVIIQLSPQLLSIVVALSVTFYINIQLGVFLLCSMLVYVYIFLRSVEPLASLQKKMHEQNSRVWGDAHDIVSNVRQVKEVVAEDEVSKKLDMGFRHTVVGTWTTMFRAWGDLYFYQKAVIFLAQLVIFIYAIQAILEGHMTIGELLAVNGYAAMVFGPFVAMGRNWQNIQNGIININETEKLLQTAEEVYVPDNAYTPVILEGRVQFENVSFSYDEAKPILKNISFTVEPGETIAVVGESGVGKTTLIDLLLGFHFATEGRVLVDAHDVTLFDLRALRKNIAVVSQDIVLFNDTVVNNIAFGHSEAPRTAVQEAAERADAKTFIESFPDAWEQLVGERGIKLSGGQRQRIAIARAILKDPRILILDEPTSALDARAEQRIQESLEEVMKGKTTFIIAHRFSTVRDADKILVLKNGEIVQTGTHEELIAVDGEYRNLYNLQIGLHE